MLATAVIQTVTVFAYGWIGANVGFTAILAFALLAALLVAPVQANRAFDRVVARAALVLGALVVLGAAILGVRAGVVLGDVAASVSWFALMVATAVVVWVRTSDDSSAGSPA